jgi:hypothetical protein
MRSWLAIPLCALAAGCIHTSVQHLDQAARPATAPDAVAVLRANPAGPYTVIATITAKGETIFDSYADLQRALVARPATLGADAVILGRKSTATDFIFAHPAMIRSDRKRLTGEAIVYSTD